MPSGYWEIITKQKKADACKWFLDLLVPRLFIRYIRLKKFRPENGGPWFDSPHCPIIWIVSDIWTSVRNVLCWQNEIICTESGKYLTSQNVNTAEQKAKQNMNICLKNSILMFDHLSENCDDLYVQYFLFAKFMLLHSRHFGT